MAGRRSFFAAELDRMAAEAATEDQLNADEARERGRRRGDECGAAAAMLWLPDSVLKAIELAGIA